MAIKNADFAVQSRFIEHLKRVAPNKSLADEMADVLWVLTCLANQTGIDLTEAIQRNMEKKTNRDKLRHIQNPKIQP